MFGQVEDTGVQIQRSKKRGGSSVEKRDDPVKVTLHDCLACSGCVTSAETVLLEHQGLQELEQKLLDPNVMVAFSVSAQSRAALAAAYNLSPAKVFGGDCRVATGTGPQPQILISVHCTLLIL